MIKLKDLIKDLELGKVYTDKDMPPFQTESVNEAKFSKDQIEIMRTAYGTLKGMNPSSPSYKKFIKFLSKLPKDQLKQLANAKIKFVSILAKNRLKGESVNEDDLGLTYKKGKTVKVTHKRSGKEIVIIDKPNVRKEYEKIGFFAERKVDEERDYKDEYKKFQSSTKAKKYRAELNKYNRKRGTYGNGDGKDASHKGGKIAGFEKESTNRGRREKSRLKK